MGASLCFAGFPYTQIQWNPVEVPFSQRIKIFDKCVKNVLVFHHEVLTEKEQENSDANAYWINDCSSIFGKRLAFFPIHSNSCEFCQNEEEDAYK